MNLAIVNYGMGNLLSVRNAFASLGAEAEVVEAGQDLERAGAIVLPGVGAFGEAMKQLRARGLEEALHREVMERKKPFLGICLGLQLLARRGHELGVNDGLGWVAGEVRRLDVAPDLRVPHIGWSEVEGRGPLFAGIPDRTAFYFVHSYHFVAEDPAVVHGTTVYGHRFTSAVAHENVVAVQFHPEKSHKWGLALLANFLAFARSA
ncbi:MAG: imidazole glycerol phosphate synthase subunit HisH [Labilithrix sp.]|nr:imidazole glycerol phosphate synthase subunit HisH [Labilithrix sp.]MCW5832802.1 imidazole glycerol phosphate synthase subunit HisH [Labilithrix sp.]